VTKRPLNTASPFFPPPSPSPIQAGAEISTVNPEQYSKRFLDFIANILTYPLMSHRTDPRPGDSSSDHEGREKGTQRSAHLAESNPFVYICWQR